jgi:arylsulfatase A-like enzyme
MKTPHWSLAVWLCSWLAVTSLAAAERGAPPNILFVLADQWRTQAFGFAGDPNAQTPLLDRLAAESVRFTHAVAGMPVCSPMRASLLTGQKPLTHGIFLNEVQLSLEAVTLPKALKAAGYDTGAIGKWPIDGHGRSSFIPRGRRQGFDYWQVLECTHAYNNSPYFGDTPEQKKWEGYDAFDQTKAATAVLRTRRRSTMPSGICWRPCARPDWRRTRSSSSPRTTATCSVRRG